MKRRILPDVIVLSVVTLSFILVNLLNDRDYTKRHFGDSRGALVLPRKKLVYEAKNWFDAC
jgi:hypothetical protein